MSTPTTRRHRHEEDWKALSEESQRVKRMASPFIRDERALHFEAAAQLLEVHDATGINLRQMGAVGDFVDHQLGLIGRGPVTDNGA